MLLQCPKIKDDKLYYGGSQDWFHDKWAQMAGCASVCATNVYVYYLNQQKVYTKEQYLHFQEKLYALLTPGKRGYPYVYHYARKVGNLLQRDYQIIRNPGVEKGYHFIKEAIDHGNPVSMLVLTHHSIRMKDDKWHWMTIFGYDQDSIYYSSYGKIKKIKTRVLLKKHRINIVKLVRFVNKNQEVSLSVK